MTTADSPTLDEAGKKRTLSKSPTAGAAVAQCKRMVEAIGTAPESDSDTDSDPVSAYRRRVRC